jgi:hypothetical protein
LIGEVIPIGIRASERRILNVVVQMHMVAAGTGHVLQQPQVGASQQRGDRRERVRQPVAVVHHPAAVALLVHFSCGPLRRGTHTVSLV